MVPYAVAIDFLADAGWSTTGSAEDPRLKVFHSVSNCSRVRLVSHGAFEVFGRGGSQTPLRTSTGVLMGTSLGLGLSAEGALPVSLAAGVCSCANESEVSRRIIKKRDIGQKSPVGK